MKEKEDKKQNVPKRRFPGFTEPWEQRRFKELVLIERGGSPRPIQDYIIDNDEEGINWVKIGDAPEFGNRIEKTSEKIKQSGLPKTRQVFPGDLILSNSMSFGKPYIMGISGCIHDGWLLIRDSNKIFDQQFLCQLLGTDQMIDQYVSLAAGSTVNNLNKDLVGSTFVTYPSLAEQKTVSLFFKKFDTLITLHQRKLDDLKLLKKGLLQKMFPKNGEKIPEIRFPGFTDDWEQRRLGDIAEFINGRAYSQDELLSEGTYPVLRVGNFYTNDSWYFSDLELEDKYYTEKGDLLYTWSATFGPHIWNGPKVIYHYHIWKVVLSDLLNKKFTVQLLEEDKAKILADKNGSTMVHITKAGMEKKKIKIPTSVEEQREIGNFLDNFDNLITLHQRKLDNLKLLKKGLLQEMFV